MTIIPGRSVDADGKRIGNHFFPKDMNYSINDVQRERTNAQVTFQYKPIDGLVATLDFTGSKAITGQETTGWGIWNEFGGNIRLTIPRLFTPFNTDKVIPKYMSPNTTINLTATSQRNIGLDKENLTGVFNYNWTPKQKNTIRFDLLNIQFIKNLNPENYFKIKADFNG